MMIRNMVAGVQSRIRRWKTSDVSDLFASVTGEKEQVDDLDDIYQLLIGGVQKEAKQKTGASLVTPEVEKVPFTEAFWFKTVIYSAIILNALIMGVEVDYPA